MSTVIVPAELEAIADYIERLDAMMKNNVVFIRSAVLEDSDGDYLGTLTQHEDALALQAAEEK